MFDEIQEALVGNRLRFAASFAGLLILFVGGSYVAANWNSDLKLGALFVHDLLLVALFALRFRQLRMSEAWSLLAFLPLFGLLVAVFLLVRNNAAPERYSSF
jgi:hypothetical protein